MWAAKNKLRKKENNRRWYLANRLRLVEEARAYRIKNKEKIREFNHQRSKTPERREQNKRSYLRRRENIQKYRRKSFLFKKKRIHLPEDPRKEVCSNCGRQRRTDMHHDEYDESDPLAYTRELCRSCHMKISPRTRDSRGRFLPKV